MGTDESQSDESRQEPAEQSASGNADSVQAVTPGGAEEVDSVVVQSPEFSSLEPSMEASEVLPLDRFYDVNVPIWAELGRVKMPIGDILKLGQGSVLKLGRRVSEPVDLIAQGVRLARGEVVVVDDCFAVRIKEVEPAKQGRA